MMRPTVLRLLKFHELLTDFAKIERVIHIKRHGKNVLESDTEHSYNLAMMAWYLSAYFPDLDRDTVMRLALVHDLVEVHAGDTFAFADQAELDTKKDREEAAQQQLAAEWPDFAALHTTIAEYELLQLPEARFVYTLDKIMPAMTIYLNNGFTWHEKQLSLQRLNHDKRLKMQAYPELLQYWDELYEILASQPNLFPVATSK